MWKKFLHRGRRHLHAHVAAHCDHSCPMAFPLSFCKAGQQVTVQCVWGGIEMKNRLEAMGFTPGTPVSIVCAHHHGPFIVKVRDSQIALGKGMSHKIQVA